LDSTRIEAMIRVADFAKSSVKSEEISDAKDGIIEEMGECLQQPEWLSPRSPPGGESYDDIADQKDDSYDAKEDYVDNDFEEKKLCNTIGLPPGFSVGNVEKQRKGDKKTFYCEMCLVELSSLDTMKSHVSGVKHMKKQMALSNELDEKVRRGMMTEEEARMSTPIVRPIPNPEPTKKKIPIRLHEKIRETRDPVVGLRFITEFIPVSDAEMEPHYECGLCGSQGQSNGMFSHLMGFKHRQMFVEEKMANNRNYHYNHGTSQADLLRAAWRMSENSEKLSDLIKTIRSDEDYPWPPSKAPWAVEKGGTGIPPTGARENYGKNKFKATPAPFSPREPEPSGEQKLPGLSSLRTPCNNEEAQKMLEVGRRLVSLAMGFSGSGLGQRDAGVIQAAMDSVLMKAQLNLARGCGR